MSGFSYNGIHCSTYQCEYIPDEKDRWFVESAYKVFDNDVAWKHGGYYYGSRAKVRQFKLKCYFEEITTATREKIRRWLSRDTSGKLIFDDRPFVYYNVRPADVPAGEIYNDTGKYSGTFTITFNAYNPFGYLSRKSNTGDEDDYAEDYCGIIPASMMPAPPTVDSRSFMVYNPGTECCGLDLKIAGSASNPIRFINKRNGSNCVISSFPETGLLEIHGDTAFVAYKLNEVSTTLDNGFAYHDKGFVRLEPCETNTGVSYTAEQNGSMYDITPSGVPITEDMVGAYLQFDNPSTLSAVVETVDTENGVLTCIVDGSGDLPLTGTMRISTMNQIEIQEQNENGTWGAASSLSLTMLKIDYQPRVL